MRIAVAVAVALALAAAAPAADASCAVTPLAEQVERADAIVEARVAAHEGGNRRALVVDVVRVLKGGVPARIRVAAGPEVGPPGATPPPGGPGPVATSVDYDAPVGTVHTLYLRRGPGARYLTDACSGSHPGGPTAEERALLGAGAAPADAAQALRTLAVSALAASLALAFVAFRRWGRRA